MNVQNIFDDLPHYRDLSNPPDRSRLFSLQPIRLGEPMQESLLSFLIRTSRAHAINPRQLVAAVLAECDPAIASLAYAGFFRRLAKTVNGLGQYAESFASALEMATRVPGLRNLTMLPWKNMFPHNGQGMLADHPQWCPRCLIAQTLDGGERYLPLAWAMDTVRVCPQHECLLEQHCPHCGKTQSFIPRYPDVGICSECGKPLVTRNVLNADRSGKQLSELKYWAASAVGSMVAMNTSTHSNPTVDAFRHAIMALVDRLTCGNRAEFCRVIGFQEHALNGWLTKAERPSMPQFLELCYRSGTEPADIAGCLGACAESVTIRTDQARLRRRAGRHRLSVLQRQKIRPRLANFLSDADCPSLSGIAKKIRVSVSCLRYWFPELCRELSVRHRAAVKATSLAHQARQIMRVGEVIRQLRSEGVYPSRRRLNGILRKEGMSLAQAHLLNAYRDAL